MTYQDAVQYLNGLLDHERDTAYDYSEVKLERMETLLEQLGNPHQALRSIHIAGTKGKGSTCAFIFSILKEAGYKVGLYTSPHLVDFKERIKISYHDEMNEIRERIIQQDEVAAMIEIIKPEADKIPGLTFFEIYTAMAFLFFSKQNVDFAVIETGLGGRLDATNVIKPLVCGISSISLDHTALLGTTLDKIAREKAGIIKENGLVVTVSQPPQAWKEIVDVCKEKNARLYEIGKDFILDPIGQNLDGSTFDFRGIFDSYQGLHINLLGQFQLVNVALALAVIQVMRLHEIVVSSLAITKGLGTAHWPGRMHILHKRPFIIVDGAQNAASAQALRAAVNMLFLPKKSILVLGVSRDKDVEGIIQNLVRHQNLIILTQAQTPRAMDVDALEKKLGPYQKFTRKTKTVQEALMLAVENLTSADDLIVIAGSLYVVGEVFSALKNIKIPNLKGAE